MSTQIITTNGTVKESENNKRRLSSFKQMREGLHISYSQITQYMICPLKFQFQYVQGLQPEYISAALPFGSAIHHSIAVLYKQLQATHQPPSRSDIQDIFVDRWEWQQKNENGVQVKFKKGKESWDSLKDMGAKMIPAYYDYADSASMLTGENVVAVELPLCGDLVQNGPDMDFVGVIDLILRDPSSPSTFHIIDHKTAARRYDETKVATDMQLSAYKWLIEKSDYLGDRDEYDLSLRWDVILKLKKEPRVERYTTVREEKDVRRFLRTTRVILRAIEQCIFYPQTGWQCTDCGFKRICDGWR